MNAIEITGLTKSFNGLYALDHLNAKSILEKEFGHVKADEDCLQVYDAVHPEAIVRTLLDHGHFVRELRKNRIGLEEYYIDLMSGKEAV